MYTIYSSSIEEVIAKRLIQKFLVETEPLARKAYGLLSLDETNPARAGQLVWFYNSEQPWSFDHSMVVRNGPIG